jgi:hypothetical protein
MFALFLILALAGCQQKTKIVPGPGDTRIVYREPPNQPPPIEPAPSPGFVTTSRLEAAMQIDLNTIQSGQEKQRTRYLVGCDRANQGLDTDEFEQGINLAVNGLSDERFLSPITKIGQNGCIYRIDLDDYTLSQADWLLIEKSTLLDFVSQTTRNQDLQFQVQSLKPWIFAADFTCLAYTCDAVAENQNGNTTYYQLTNQANLTANFFAQQGINVQQEVNDENVLLAGFDESIIALGKTRLLQVIESDNGFVLSSFDTNLGGDDLFQNPSPFSRQIF